jgi:hypothetical protein
MSIGAVQKSIFNIPPQLVEIMNRCAEVNCDFGGTIKMIADATIGKIIKHKNLKLRFLAETQHIYQMSMSDLC